MSTDKLISVIMPCYNAGDYLMPAIESVMQQQKVSIELIIIDDGSSDHSLATINQAIEYYGDRICLIKQDHQGPFPARNKGLAIAKGEFIAFLDADDYWSEDCLHSLLDAVHTRNLDCAYCGWQNVGDTLPDERKKPYIPPAYEQGDAVEFFLEACPWPIHAALCKKSLIDKIGGFSCRYFSAMDYDLWLQLIAHSRNIGRVEKVMAFYRWHDGGQISAIKWKQIINAWKVRVDFLKTQTVLCAHISPQRKRELSDYYLQQKAYEALWRREHEAAWRLFRQALFHTHWRLKDLHYMVSSLLPLSLYTAFLDFRR